MPFNVEYEIESVRRLARAVWMIGQGMMVEDKDNETGPAIKQLAEEIEDHLKLFQQQEAGARA